MEPITIPKEMHEKMIKTLQLEYEDEFGPLSQVRNYTREELIHKYALDILFWQKRQPEIGTSKRPDMRKICAHAIASNAITNMWKLCDERKIRSEVAQVLSQSANSASSTS